MESAIVPSGAGGEAISATVALVYQALWFGSLGAAFSAHHRQRHLATILRVLHFFSSVDWSQTSACCSMSCALPRCHKTVHRGASETVGLRRISLQDSDGKQLFSFLIWKTQSYLRSREQHLRIFVVKVGSRVVALTSPCDEWRMHFHQGERQLSLTVTQASAGKLSPTRI